MINRPALFVGGPWDGKTSNVDPKDRRITVPVFDPVDVSRIRGDPRKVSAPSPKKTFEYHVLWDLVLDKGGKEDYLLIYGLSNTKSADAMETVVQWYEAKTDIQEKLHDIYNIAMRTSGGAAGKMSDMLEEILESLKA